MNGIIPLEFIAMIQLQEILGNLRRRDSRAIGRAISLIENQLEGSRELLDALEESSPGDSIFLGVTGAPGSGKSTLTNQLVARYRGAQHRVGIVAVDPSSPKTGGALLGDRIRLMAHARDPDVVVRSMATRSRLGGLCAAARGAARIMEYSGCERVILETVGVGQSEMDVARIADLTLLVLAPGMGDDIQAMKAGIVEMADILVVNKSDQPGADRLAQEMEAVARERGQPVCLTDALTPTGVEALVQTIDKVALALEQTGERRVRRQGAREFEILDCAVELIRPRLAAQLKLLTGVKGDRREVAERIVDSLCLGECLNMR